MQLIYAFESWIIPPNLRNFNTLLPSRTLLWISSNFAREEVTSHRFHFLLFRLLRLGSNRALFIIVVVIPFKLLFFCAFSELVNLRTMAPMSRSRFFFFSVVEDSQTSSIIIVIGWSKYFSIVCFEVKSIYGAIRKTTKYF